MLIADLKDQISWRGNNTTMHLLPKINYHIYKFFLQKWPENSILVRLILVKNLAEIDINWNLTGKNVTDAAELCNNHFRGAL